MTLSLVFRIQAVMFAIFGFMMLIMPGAMMSSFMPDVGENAVAESIMQGMSLMVIGMAYLSWQMPNWKFWIKPKSNRKQINSAESKSLALGVMQRVIFLSSLEKMVTQEF